MSNMIDETKTLQYQLSNGNWINCDDRTDEFYEYCENATGKTRPEIVSALEAGKTVRNDTCDWYSNCRDKPAPRPVAQVEMVKCSCGHSVPREAVMSASMGTSCPDCYDRMSD